MSARRVAAGLLATALLAGCSGGSTHLGQPVSHEQVPTTVAATPPPAPQAAQPTAKSAPGAPNNAQTTGQASSNLALVAASTDNIVTDMDRTLVDVDKALADIDQASSDASRNGDYPRR